MRKNSTSVDFLLSLPVAGRPSRGLPERHYYQTTPQALKDLRRRAGLTQAQAAQACLSTLKEWREFESGRVRMHPAIYKTLVLAIPRKGKALRKARSA